MHNHRKPNPALEVASNMPPLAHFTPMGFDIMRSQAVAWLIKQPEIRQWLWNRLRDTGVITYDVETKTWRGVNWKW
jgi:hypothetical protein